MRYVRLRRGIWDLRDKVLLPFSAGSFRNRNNPHGFIGVDRVWGFWAAIRRGFLTLKLDFPDDDRLESYGWCVNATLVLGD